MKERTVEKEKEIFRRQARLHLIIGGLFLLASLWDFGVTFYHYLMMDDFTYWEANIYLSWGLDTGLPFIYNPAVVLNFWMGAYYTFFRIPYDPRRRRGADYFWFYFMAFGIIGHAFGGASWLIWA